MHAGVHSRYKAVCVLGHVRVLVRVCVGGQGWKTEELFETISILFNHRILCIMSDNESLQSPYHFGVY